MKDGAAVAMNTPEPVARLLPDRSHPSNTTKEDDDEA